MLNGLGRDEDRISVGPDLCPNCLQRLSVNDARKKLKKPFVAMIVLCQQRKLASVNYI